MNDDLHVFVWFLFTTGCGSLPISMWLARWVLGVDIRRVGDGNPGATNVYRAGGKWVALAALLLDMLKAAVPIAMARTIGGLEGLTLAVIATGPLLGHAFSPFLGFRGGKAIAAAGGAWAGLTVWLGPALLSSTLWIVSRRIQPDGWAVVLTHSAWLPVILGLHAVSAHSTGVVEVLLWPLTGLGGPISRDCLVMAWLLMSLVLVWTHRYDLCVPPRWVMRQARKSSLEQSSN